MIKKIIFIAIIILFVNCDNKILNKTKSNDEFFVFYSKFRQTDTSLVFDFKPSWGVATQFGEIEEEYVKNYICDITNFCHHKVFSDSIEYYYVYSIPVSENFYTIIYAMAIRTMESRYIMINYSKNDFKKISQFLVYGTDAKNYTITSTIDTNFMIKQKSFYIETGEHQYSNYDNYCYVQERITNYLIDSSGKFVNIEDSGMKRFLGLNTDRGFVYPVLPPE